MPSDTISIDLASVEGYCVPEGWIKILRYLMIVPRYFMHYQGWIVQKIVRTGGNALTPCIWC
jgi:hypothetical protein